MSRYIHDAILVTTFSDRYATMARDKAVAIGLPVTEIVGSLFNGFRTFLIAPTGSSLQYPEAGDHDLMRGVWVGWAKDQIKMANARDAGEEDGAFLTWVHVRWGEIKEPGGCNAAIVGRHVGSV